MVSRRSVRKRVAEAILVTNAMTGETLARVGNLSVDGMMLISPRFIIFAAPMMLGTWFLRNVGKDIEERRVQGVAREIEKAALANLTAPKP